MSILALIGLTMFWAVGLGAVSWTCYSWGYTRGRLFQIERAPAAAPTGLTKKDVMSLLGALEKIVDFAAEMAPINKLMSTKPVHH